MAHIPLEWWPDHGCVHNHEYWRYLEPQSVFAIIVGLILFFGTTLSTIPQFVSIISANSSYGIAYLTLVLANINQFGSFLSGFVSDWNKFLACWQVGFFGCYSNIIGLSTLFALFVIWLGLSVVFLVYFDFKQTANAQKQYKKALISVILVFLMLAITFTAVLIFIYAYGDCSPLVKTIGSLGGIVATSVNLVQWCPQIYQTYKLKSGGALSLLMLCINSPGCAAICLYLALAEHENIFTWGSYFTSFLQQGILVCMLVYYRYIDKSNSGDDTLVAEPPVISAAIAVGEAVESTLDSGLRKARKVLRGDGAATDEESEPLLTSEEPENAI